MKNRMIEIIKQSAKPCERGECKTCEYDNLGENCWQSKLADDIIANGATLQQWISVSERLPDDSGDVILCTRSRIVGVGFYDKMTRSWVQHYSGGGICIDVTHWMPLPELPKENE